jgi:phenylacetate-coenzyme A ligase PaaK-like adenylate-forming protein
MVYELSVIAPCYNEEGNLRELVNRLRNAFWTKNIAGEVVLVDDGSTDGTGTLIDKLAQEHPNVVAVHHGKNLGMVAGWRSGLQAAHGDLVCLIDADLQNLPEDVCRLYRELRLSGADVVQGYRSSVGRIRDSRYRLSKTLNFILNTCFGMRLRDNKSGFIICRRDVLADVLRHRFRYHYFQSLIMVAAKSKGYTIREIETLFESRLVGKSFISRFPAVLIYRVFTDIAKAIFEYRISDQPATVLGEYLRGLAPLDPAKETLSSWRRALFSLYTWTMPLHAWLISRNVKTYYEQLKRSQWLIPAQIQEIQELKLRELIHQAYYHVGYYRDMFDRLGLSPADIRNIEDLGKLPLLDKKTVRSCLYFDLLSDNHDKRKMLKVTTSGSTGEPFVCYADKNQLEMRWAATLRSMEWTGYRFGDRQARLWHQTIGMSFGQVLRERIDGLLSRRLFIPAYEMSDRNLPQSIAKLRRFKPVLIDGYAESFNFLAYYIKQHGLEGVKPKGIISSAQALPDQSRAVIETAFGCGVFDKYGSREFSGIAYESDGHDGHLVVAENYIVEILKDGHPAKPGELGEVVITDLHNRCMPLIRYRVGDLAIAIDSNTTSPCGRGLPRIGRIEGRAQAIIIGANGNYLPGTFFMHYFKDFDYVVKQFQIIQDRLGHLTLKIVKADRFNDQLFEKILEGLRKFVGEKMEMEIEFVDSIPLVRTGKHQATISHLNLDFQRLSPKEIASS